MNEEPGSAVLRLYPIFYPLPGIKQHPGRRRPVQRPFKERYYTLDIRSKTYSLQRLGFRPHEARPGLPPKTYEPPKVNTTFHARPYYCLVFRKNRKDITFPFTG